MATEMIDRAAAPEDAKPVPRCGCADLRPDELLKAVSQLRPLMNRRKESPRFAERRSLWIEANGESMTLSASDGVVWRSKSIGVSGGLTPFACGVDGCALLAATEARAEDTFTLDFEAETKLLRVRYQRGTVCLPATGEAPFTRPQVEGMPLILPWDQLRAALKALRDLPAETSSAGVHYSQGFWLEAQDGKLEVVATDGHRLATVRLDAPGLILPPAKPPTEQQEKFAKEHPGLQQTFSAAPGLILDGAPVMRLLKDRATEEPPLLIILGEEALLLEWAACSYVLPILDVKRPAWRRIMPPESPRRMTVNLGELSYSLSRIAALIGALPEHGYNMARLLAKDTQLTVSWRDPAVGLGLKERMACNFSGSLSVSVNPGYLLSLSPKEAVTLTLDFGEKPHTPIFICTPEKPEWRAILMPIAEDLK